MFLKRIPKFLSDHFRLVKWAFKYKYYQVFCWLLIAQSIYPGKANVANLSRWTPQWIVYKWMLRLLASDQWDFEAVFHWEWMQVYMLLPLPPNGIIYLTVDATLVEKTGKKNPVNGKTKIRKDDHWRYGFYVVVLMLGWGPYRLPIDFRVVRKKDDPDYKNQNQLFQEMLNDYFVPAWTSMVIVLADTGFASKENLKTIQGKRMFFVFSFARTWKFDDPDTGDYHHLKEFVKQINNNEYQKIWFKDIDGKRRCYWVYAKTVRLNVVGTVTMVISKKRRNTRPEKAKILVTNIPDISAREVVKLYTRRWYVECLFRELKSACGLGHHQVGKDAATVDRSVATSMMAYILILRFEYQRIPQDKHWSMLTLKHFFTCRVLQAQFDDRKSSKKKKKRA